MAYILAADVGGTKTNIGIFDSEHGCRNPVVEETLLCKNYSSFNELLKDFLAGKEYPVESACFGVAGPVRNGRVQLTNLPWLLEEEELKQVLGIKSVFLINDLVALGHSIPELTEKDIITLHEGSPEKHGTIGIVAPGTGLGMAFLVWDGAKYIVCPSEGGHASFSPQNDLEMKLLSFYRKQGYHVSFEFLCSGKGIPYIYKFLKENDGLDEPEWLRDRLNKASDWGPVIISFALDESIECELCSATVNFFIDTILDFCENFSLTIMATGGIYLGGGIPPRVLKKFQEKTVTQKFKKNGLMYDLGKRIPLKMILDPKASLLGAAKYAVQQFEK